MRIHADIAIVDMPIGLTDSGKDREFDKMARELLGERRSSVFSVPCRKAIYQARTYEEACEMNKEITGKKISKQSWAIIPKIREIDEYLQANPNKGKMLQEDHPEVCFTRLLGHPCQYHKREQQGENERIAVLKKHMDIYGMAFDHPYSTKEIARDDIIDAAVLALFGLQQFTNPASA